MMALTGVAVLPEPCPLSVATVKLDPLRRRRIEVTGSSSLLSASAPEAVSGRPAR